MTNNKICHPRKIFWQTGCCFVFKQNIACQKILSGISFLYYHPTQTISKEHNYFVYMLASEKDGRIYIGMTNGLFKRVSEHKAKKDPNCFTAKYNVTRLVYYENFHYVWDAISREKELKHWNRQWKIELLEKENPTWRDYYNDMLYRYDSAPEKDPR